MDEAAQAGGVDVLPDGWIRDAWTPQPAEPKKYTVGYGYYWQKEHLVIAVNSASVDHHGIGLARWDLIAAIRKVAL